jgi:hypothetical protein
VRLQTSGNGTRFWGGCCAGARVAMLNERVEWGSVTGLNGHTVINLALQRYVDKYI